MSAKNSAKEAVRASFRAGTLHGLYPARYRQKAAAPVDRTKVVFLEVREDKLTDSFLTVYDALEKQRKWKLVTCCLEEGMKDHLTVVKNCLGAIDQIADARWVFVNDSSYMLGCLPLRPETKVIQLWHACGAFKKFGYSIAQKGFGSGREQMEKYPLYRNFSYVTVSSKEVAWAYAEAFGMENAPEKIVATGIARTDRYYDENLLTTAREKTLSVLPPALSGKVRKGNARLALYAPTFRGKVAMAASPNQLDLKELKEKAGKQWILLIAHHPFVKRQPAVPEECRDFAVNVTGKLPIETLLMAADVCITDYSSIVFEYALLGRPMAFFAPDLKEYDDFRGFYYPYEEMTPGPVMKKTGQVAAFLEDPEKYFDREKMNAFREKFMGACDGHATGRILALMK